MRDPPLGPGLGVCWLPTAAVAVAGVLLFAGLKTRDPTVPAVVAPLGDAVVGPGVEALELLLLWALLLLALLLLLPAGDGAWLPSAAPAGAAARTPAEADVVSATPASRPC